MTLNLQPKVAARQQLIVKSVRRTLQPMVAGTEKEVVLKFVERLTHAMNELKLPRRGRPQWLSDQFKAVGQPVTYQATQKWLEGHSMPRGTRWQALADLLRVNIAWLRDGQGPMKKALSETGGALLERMHTAWRALPDDTVRLEVLHYVEHRASLGEIHHAVVKAGKSLKGF